MKVGFVVPWLLSAMLIGSTVFQILIHPIEATSEPADYMYDLDEDGIGDENGIDFGSPFEPLTFTSYSHHNHDEVPPGLKSNASASSGIITLDIKTDESKKGETKEGDEGSFTNVSIMSNENDGRFQSKLSWIGDQIFGCLLVTFCFLALVGNSCTLIMFCFRHRRLSPAEVFFVNLAVVDILLSIASYPMSTIASFKHRWDFEEFGCTLYAFVCYFLGVASIFSITAIALIRYLKTCTPAQEEALLPFRKGVRGQSASEEDMKKVAIVNSENWKPLVGKTRLGAGYSDTCHNYMSVENRELWTHIRLNYYPDGGVARLRIFGRIKRTLQDILNTSADLDGWVDLLAKKSGGYCVGLSDAHYGHPRNLILDEKTRNISDGWETARKLERPEMLAVDGNGNLDLYGFEWAAFRLGLPGVVNRIDVDTATFRGNYPYACKIEGCCLNFDEEQDQGQLACLGAGFQQCKDSPWRTLMSMTKLEPDKNHIFDLPQLEQLGPITHIRVTIYPDGGLGKLRIWGVPVAF